MPLRLWVEPSAIQFRVKKSNPALPFAGEQRTCCSEVTTALQSNETWTRIFSLSFLSVLLHFPDRRGKLQTVLKCVSSRCKKRRSEPQKGLASSHSYIWCKGFPCRFSSIRVPSIGADKLCSKGNIKYSKNRQKSHTTKIQKQTYKLNNVCKVKHHRSVRTTHKNQ